MTFTVLIDDNFHYMDESERSTAGEFATLAEALRAAQNIVDECLSSAFHPGITGDELAAGYLMFGEDPFIVSAEITGVAFSAREYARQRVSELCGASGESACECDSAAAPASLFGTVRSFQDVHGCNARVAACGRCRRRWLEYVVEAGGSGESTRWWRAALGPESADTLTPDRVRTYLQSSTWCFVGGSYYGGEARRQSAPIVVF